MPRGNSTGEYLLIKSVRRERVKDEENAMHVWGVNDCRL